MRLANPSCFSAANGTDGPRAHQRLVEQVLLVGVRCDEVLTMHAVAFVQGAPLRPPLGPLGRQFRQDVDAGPDVFAALGVVGGRRRQGVRKSLLATLHLFMKCGRGDAEAIGIAADLVERDEPVRDVAGGVLGSLRHDRGRDLLELADEAALFLDVLRPGRGGGSAEQGVADEVEDRHAHAGIADRGPAHGPQHLPAVGLGDVGPGDVRAVDREARDHLAERPAQAAAGEVAGAAVVLGDAVELVRQHLHFAGQGDLEDEQLLLVDEFAEGRTLADRIAVEAGEGPFLRAVDEQAVHEVEELVAAGAGGRPTGRKRLVRRQDLLDDRVEVAAARLLEPTEVFARIEQAVGMIDADAADLAVAEETQDQLMRRIEDVLALHAEGGQLVDVEEPAVVDLLRGDAPKSEPIRLVVEHLFEQIETRGVAGRAVELGHRAGDEVADRRILRGQRSEAPLDDLLLALPFGDEGGVGLVAARQMLDRGEDALEFVESRVAGAELRLQLRQPVHEDKSVAARSDGEAVVEVADRERAGVVFELQLLRFEDLDVRFAEDRDEDAALELGAGRRGPGDVEVAGVGRRRAVLEDVVPPGVFAADHGHVVGDDVEQNAHAARLESIDPGIELGLGADFGIEVVVIGDVVAVRAVWTGFQDRRGVGVGDAEVCEVRDDRKGVTEGERLAELEAIGRTGDLHGRSRAGGEGRSCHVFCATAASAVRN